ncbi:MAG: hypothetical protein HY654_06585 [Acidobacteria bacterium]|nr:hypothetical protein [Acidobacteriota bacterium]
MARRRIRPFIQVGATALLIISATRAPLLAQNPAVVTASNATAETAKTWVDDRAVLEEFIRTARVERVQEIGMGVTNPKRAYFAPGGPIASASWKPIRPGRYSGHWENYKSEIAAYELDKLLGMNMVPPTVERTIDGEAGAATLWVAPVRMFKMGENTRNIPNPGNWDRQVRKMKTFDLFIHNPDRNAGNLLIDPAGNLILIDHSRAFESWKRLVSKVERLDRDLWKAIDALTPEAVTAAVQKWLTAGEIRGLLDRRELMRAEIAKLVAAKGEAAVLIP